MKNVWQAEKMDTDSAAKADEGTDATTPAAAASSTSADSAKSPPPPTLAPAAPVTEREPAPSTDVHMEVTIVCYNLWLNI